MTVPLLELCWPLRPNAKPIELIRWVYGDWLKTRSIASPFLVSRMPGLAYYCRLLPHRWAFVIRAYDQICPKAELMLFSWGSISMQSFISILINFRL